MAPYNPCTVDSDDHAPLHHGGIHYSHSEYK